MATKPAEAMAAAAVRKNTYNRSECYAGSSVPTKSFGSTKGKKVAGNPNAIEVHLSATYVPLRARRMAKLAAATTSSTDAAAAGKKQTPPPG
jgi:hypothetical protein